MPAAVRATVIIPAWRAAGTIGGTLASLVEDNSDDVGRIIVVASPGDPTAELAAAFSRVTVVRPAARLTAGAARNLGRRAAPEAGVLLFVDADCRLGAGVVARLVAALDSDGLGAAAAALLADGGGLLAWTRHALEFKEWGPRGRPGPTGFAPSAVLACRAEDFDRAGGFIDMWPGEDLVFCHRLAECGLRVGVVREAVARHRHPAGLLTMFGHQYRLGYTSALARLETGMKGAFLARAPLLAPLLLPARTVRAFLWFTTHGIRELPAFVLALPLYMAGLVAWTLGFTRCALDR